MRLDDCYTLLDVRPGATAEELKLAHRDLTKVWHPDRFASDPTLRRKAEEKLKAINEAYETILGSRGPDDPEPPTDSTPGDAIRRQAVRNRTWALTCLAAAVFVLLRRPTPGGLLIALLLLCMAFVLIMRVRAR